MANARALIKQSELTRYFKAWRAAGFGEPRAEIRPDGTVIILPVEDRAGDGQNDWDAP